jgi:hypothetical protein
VESAKKFKKHIIQIKINALNEVKKNIQNKVDITTTKVISKVSIVPDTFITIEDAFEEYLKTGDSLSENHKKTSERDVKHFIKFCNMNKIEYIQKVQNKYIINYRDYLKELKPNVKIGALNLPLKNISAFLNHCSEVLSYIPTITKKTKFKQAKREKRVKKAPILIRSIKNFLTILT